MKKTSCNTCCFVPKKIFEFCVLMIIGGAIYYGIEVLHRGYSHWSMFLLGGLCFVLVGSENEFFHKEFDVDIPLFPQMIIGSLIITLLEFITGYIVNIKLGWDVWDYSDQPFNIMGQICPGASFAWFWLSLVCILLDDYLRHKLFGEEKRKYKIF